MSEPLTPKSPELFDTIARISVNWGLVDNLAGAILGEIYKLDRQAASDLVHAIDLRKKIDLLLKNFKAGKIPAGAEKYVKAAVHANKHYRQNRNLVAHGMFSDAWDDQEAGLLSFKNDKYLSASELGIVLEQSRYAVVAIRGILGHVISGGKYTEPLPEQPDLPAS